MRKIDLKQKLEERLKLLIYGASGTGKTTSIKTLPEKGTLILSTEPQTPTRLAGTGYECWQVDSWSDIDVTIHEMLMKDDLEKTPSYRIVVIDSLTMLDIMSQEQIAMKDRAAAKGTSMVQNMYEDVLTREDYRVLNVRWTRFLMKYTNLQKHIIMIARESERRDDRTGVISFAPEITGKLSLSIGAYFTDVYRLEARAEGAKFKNRFLCKKLDNTITKGHELLDTYETGTDGTVNLSKITKKIFDGGKK